MSEDNAPDEGASVNDLQAKLRIAEKRLKELDERAATADSVARENAFLKAGINPEDPKMKYFAKGYDGEMTKDAILAELISAGLADAPKPDPAGQAMSRVAEVAGGADSSGNVDTQYSQEVAAATTQEQVMAIAEKYGKATSYSLE